jgi:hypothetical protein
VRVVLWVCPTPGCGNYYASSSAGELDTEWNHDAKGKPTSARAQCPDCNRRGTRVNRHRVELEDIVARALAAYERGVRS